MTSGRQNVRNEADHSQGLFEVASVITNTGIRPQDLERLRWNDVNFIRRRMVLKTLRHGWPRYVAFGQHTMQLLISRRERRAGSDYVLGNSMWKTQFAVRSQLQVACRTLGVEGANLRVLRWTFMKRWLDAGLCTHSLARILGHRSYFEVGEDGLGPEQRFEVDSRLQERLEESLCF